MQNEGLLFYSFSLVIPLNSIRFHQSIIPPSCQQVEWVFHKASKKFLKLNQKKIFALRSSSQDLLFHCHCHTQQKQLFVACNIWILVSHKYLCKIFNVLSWLINWQPLAKNCLIITISSAFFGLYDESHIAILL